MDKKKTPTTSIPETSEAALKAKTEKACIVVIYAKGKAETIFANLNNNLLIKHYQMIQLCPNDMLENENDNRRLIAAKTDALTTIENMLKGRGIDYSKHIVPESLDW